MSNMPIITLEVLSDSSNIGHNIECNEIKTDNTDESQERTGVHFLTEKAGNIKLDRNDNNQDEELKECPRIRNDLLEYMTRSDGSVICKLCGEILQSRTHWYRHKYKLHVIQPLNPAPLFQCEQCLVYFKSRKGYIGHLASRHSDILSDSSPVLSNTQAEAARESFPMKVQTPEVVEEPDPELSIPKTSVPNYQNIVVRQTPIKTTEQPKKSIRVNKVSEQSSNSADWDEKRSKEEKLVADIIDRVRRECEAQGSGGATRRGYTRRTTVMHT